MKEGEDYYVEGGFMIFTREYHLKRGYCCKNDCRHCPWNKAGSQKQRKNKIEEKRL
jgi:hypothetical protein